MDPVEQIEQIPLAKIVADEQVRKSFNQALIDELGASLKAVGQLQPCRLRRVDDKYVIVDGERRFLALSQAGRISLAAIVEGAELTKGEIIQRQLIANCQREDLSAMDTAMAIAELMRETGWKIGEAAKKLGVSNASATKLTALLTLPEGIREQVKSGAISPSAAYELSRIDDASEQSTLAEELAARRLTRDGLAGAVKTRSRKSDKKANATISRSTACLGAGRSVTIVAQSLDLESFIQILKELLEKARKAVPQGVELGTFIKMLKDQAISSAMDRGNDAPAD